MTNEELITRLSHDLIKAVEEIATLKKRISNAQRHIYCIGGPLNDNKLGFTKEQMLTFKHIDDDLNGGYEETTHDL